MVLIPLGRLRSRPPQDFSQHFSQYFHAIGATVTSQLYNAFRTYETALTELEATATPTPMQLLAALLARDAVRDAPLPSPRHAASILIEVFQFDRRLQQQTETLTQIPALKRCYSQWRDRIKPPEDAWWWFPNAPKSANELEKLLANYEAALTTLDKTIQQVAAGTLPSLSVQTLISIFLVRDALQTALNQAEATATTLVQIARFDLRLQTLFEHLPGENISDQSPRFGEPIGCGTRTPPSD